jgi:tape measure domain-containing protein
MQLALKIKADMAEAIAEVNKMMAAIGSLNAAAGKVSGSIDGAGKAAAQAASAIGDTGRAAASGSEAIGAIGEAVAGAANNMSGMDAAAAQVSSAIGDVGAAVAQGSEAISAIGETVAGAANDMSGMDAAAAQVSSAIGDVGAAVAQVANDMSGMDSAAAQVSNAIGGAGAAAAQGAEAIGAIGEAVASAANDMSGMDAAAAQASSAIDEVSEAASRVPGALNSVSTAVARVADSMDKADAAATRGSSAISGMSAAVSRANFMDAARDVGQFTSAIDGINRSASKAQGGVESIGRQLMSMRNVAIGGLGIAGIASLSNLIKLTDEYGQMASRIKMATESAEEYEMVQFRLQNTANNTYRSLAEAQEVFIRTSGALKNIGYSTQQALDITDSLSYGFVVNAASGERAAAAMSAFSRAIEMGKIHSMQWQTLLSAVPTLVDDIAEATGRTSEEVRKLGAEGEGKLPLLDLLEGLRKTDDKNLKKAADMPVTVADAFTKLKNSLQVFLGELNYGTGFTQVFVGALEGMGSAINFLTEHLDVLSIKFGGIGGLVDSIGLDSGAIKGFLFNAFANWPENVRAMIQIVVVEYSAFVQKMWVYAGQIKDALLGIEENSGESQRRLEAITKARLESIDAIFKSRDATLAAADAARKEGEAQRRALRAQIDAQRGAAVKLRNPDGEKKENAKQDPVERAWFNQQQSLTLALAQAKQKLANAQNDVDESNQHAADSLAIWLQTNREAARMSSAQVAGLKEQARAVDAVTREYNEFAEAKKRVEAIKTAVEGLETERLRLMGDDKGADERELKARFADLRKMLDAEIRRGNLGVALDIKLVAEVEALTLNQQAVDRLMADIDRVDAAASQRQASISTNKDVGLMTDVAAQEALIASNLNQAKQLRALLPDLERMTTLPGAMGEQASAALSKMKNEIELLEATATVFEATLKNGISEGLTQAISGLADGTMNLREAIHELSSTIFSSLLEMYSKNLTQYLMGPEGFGGLMEGFMAQANQGAGGAGGVLGAIFGNGVGSGVDMAASAGEGAALMTAGTTLSSAGVALTGAGGSLTGAGGMLSTAAAALQSAAAQMLAAQGSEAASGVVGAAASTVGGMMLASGGYTGPGGKWTPAGIVHRGEFVTRKAVTEQPGALAFLSDFNRVGMQAVEDWRKKHSIPGFAEGGFVPAAPARPASAVTLGRLQTPAITVGGASVDNRIALNLIDDPDRIASVLRSPAGEKAFTAVISRNPQKFRQLLGV